MNSDAQNNFEKALHALCKEDVSVALSVVTGCFVSLTLAVLERKGHDTDGEIKVDGGKNRDITIHKKKD